MNPVIINKGNNNTPKNVDSKPTMNVATNASMKITISQILKIFCIFKAVK